TAILVKGRAKPRQGVCCGFGSKMIVGIDSQSSLAVLNFDRGNLRSEVTGGLGTSGLMLAGQGEGVLLISRYVVATGNVLGSNAHVVAAEGIRQAVGHHGVDEAHSTHLR